MPDLPSPYSVTPRKQLTNAQRLRMFLDADGKCAICGERINGVREAWDEHMTPLWLGGSNEMWNRKPVHVRCAQQKTSKEATDRAKGRRAAEFHFGAKRPKRIMPGSRRHHLKKKLDGSVVRRWGPEEDDG